MNHLSFLYVGYIKIGLDVGQIEKLRDVKDIKSEDSDCDVRCCVACNDMSGKIELQFCTSTQYVSKLFIKCSRRKQV